MCALIFRLHVLGYVETKHSEPICTNYLHKDCRQFLSDLNDNEELATIDLCTEKILLTSEQSKVGKCFS